MKNKILTDFSVLKLDATTFDGIDIAQLCVQRAKFKNKQECLDFIQVNSDNETLREILTDNFDVPNMFFFKNIRRKKTIKQLKKSCKKAYSKHYKYIYDLIQEANHQTIENFHHFLLQNSKNTIEENLEQYIYKLLQEQKEIAITVFMYRHIEFLSKDFFERLDDFINNNKIHFCLFKNKDIFLDKFKCLTAKYS